MELRTLTRRQRRHAVREMLGAQRLAELLEWAGRDGRVVEGLFALLFEQDDLLRWRAIEALGRVAGDLADTKIDTVRDMLRRLLWSMNDESGAAGWHAPEAIGAILGNVPPLIDEFGPILGSFLNDETFETGAHWGVARVAEVRPDVYADRLDDLAASLRSEHPFVRACAVEALAAMGAETAIRKEASLLDDEAVVTLCRGQTGKPQETTVGKLAKLALGMSR